MQETNLLKTIVNSLKNNIFIYLLILLSSAASFYVGTLWSKVQMYEKGLAQGASDKVLPAADQALNGGAEKKIDLAKPTDKDHVRGDAKAEIALIVYSDFSCSYCQRFHETAKQAMNEYKGKIKWVYRHFPLTQLHPYAQKQAVASECIAKIGGNDKFWEFADAISTSTVEFDDAQIRKTAENLGINTDAFSKCYDGDETAAIVNADYQSGIKAGVTGTPGNFLLNTKTGEIVPLQGAVPYEQLKASIDEMLK